MWKVKKILAPTDLSRLSQAGVRGALELADSQGAEVVVFSVVEYPDSYSRPTEELSPGSVGVRSVDEILGGRAVKLERFLGRYFPDLIQKVKVRWEVALGDVYESIVEKAAQERVDIVVMSTRGRTGLERILLGSVTEQVVRRSPCQVLSVRQAAA
jgi:universal stress protein A